MKPKSRITLIAGAVIIACILAWQESRAKLPRIPLRDGSECRVLRVTYTAGPSDSTDHNLYVPRGRLWIYRHLPESLQRKVPGPGEGIGYTSSHHPALSIWWAHFEATTHKPAVGEAGDVLMTEDSGKQTNLGWPDPAEDYRQIFVTDPPTNSKRLKFQFPIWGEEVSFTIDNPAYHR